MSNIVEVILRLNNSAMKTGLEQARAQISNFKSKADVSVVGNLAKDVAAAENPLDALAVAAQTLGSHFKVAGLAAIGIGAGLVIKDKLEAASAAASELFDAVNDISKVNLADSTVADLEGIQKKAEELEKRAGSAGWIQKILFGEGLKAAAALASQIFDQAKVAADQNAAAAVDRGTGLLTADGATRTRAEFEDRINAAQKAGRNLEAQALEFQRDKQIYLQNNLMLNEKEKRQTDEMLKKEGDLSALRIKAFEATAQAEYDSAGDEKKQTLLEAQIRAQEMVVKNSRDEKTILETQINLLENKQKLSQVIASQEAEAAAAESKRNSSMDKLNQKRQTVAEKKEANLLKTMSDPDKAAHLNEKLRKQEAELNALRNTIGPVDPAALADKQGKVEDTRGQLLDIIGSLKQQSKIDTSFGPTFAGVNYNYQQEGNKVLKDILTEIKKQTPGETGDARFGGGT